MEQQLLIVDSLYTIWSVNAKNLLKHFWSGYMVFNASESKLQEVGVDKTAHDIIMVIGSTYLYFEKDFNYFD